jgi:chorismate-pyruvate lyase
MMKGEAAVRRGPLLFFAGVDAGGPWPPCLLPSPVRKIYSWPALFFIPMDRTARHVRLIRSHLPKRGARVWLAIAAAAVLVAAPAQAQPAPVWPDALLTRTQALALVQSLNAEILASRSATATLERWCGDHALAPEPRVVAEVLAGEPRAPTAEQRQRLGADSAEVVRYRRVRLRCGNHVLSEAENWYLPARLTPEMNHALETGNTPFGRVVAPLQPYRQTFAARLLWSPLPEGWELSTQLLPPCQSSGPLAIPGALFEHRAVVHGRDSRPIAEVHEVYQGALLAFSPPGPC